MLPQLVLNYPEIFPTTWSGGRRKAVSHFSALHKASIGATRGAYGNDCRSLTSHKCQHLLHVTLPDRQQVAILIQGNIGKRPVSGCGIYSEVSGIAVKHLD
jgi:hypothetical protein